MFTVTVRDHMMIAHSLRGAAFGPAQALHGATYVADATFEAAELTRDGIVIDIALATDALHRVLADLTLRNLDDDPSLAGVNTTTEMLAKVVADRLAQRLSGGDTGDPEGSGAGTGATDGMDGVSAITVTLHESPMAWASYRRAR
jgi:6-pyruvoyl-tetrahydropterin synthase